LAEIVYNPRRRRRSWRRTAPRPDSRRPTQKIAPAQPPALVERTRKSGSARTTCPEAAIAVQAIGHPPQTPGCVNFRTTAEDSAVPRRMQNHPPRPYRHVWTTDDSWNNKMHLCGAGALATCDQAPRHLWSMRLACTTATCNGSDQVLAFIPNELPRHARTHSSVATTHDCNSTRIQTPKIIPEPPESAQARAFNSLNPLPARDRYCSAR
jgi:hypothetical protein